jgi:hypothetical protein
MRRQAGLGELGRVAARADASGVPTARAAVRVDLFGQIP